MSKIGIITIHNSPNYGACLQSFALYEYLRLKGNEVEIIDLHRPYHYDYIPSRRFKPYEHRFESNIQTIKRILRQEIKKLLGRNTPPHYNSEIQEDRVVKAADEKFFRFNSQIKLSGKYRSIDELYQFPPVYDIYLTGSDQVWNPTQSYCIEPYFLTFVKKGKKVSYASSIGIESLANNELKSYRKWLRDYDFISVREENAKTLIERLLKRNIDLVPDPTFLLGQKYWQEKAIYPKQKGYVLVFTLSFDQRILEYGCEIAKQNNLDTISLNSSQPEDISKYNYLPVTNAGPEEWLGYIANADLVITDSFHCTLFSILLNTKDFRTYIAPDSQRGSRITNLLSIFSLENHLLADRDINENRYDYKALDSSIISKKVIEQQNIGENFLKRAL